MKPSLLSLGLCFLLTSQVTAEESFPGQTELAAGMACHRNLDMVCALSRLEKALAAFSPETDPDYLKHVISARFVLALIHVARDDLQRAEKEFELLLLLEPKFELPAGDHPPKLLFVFKTAKDKLAASRKPVVTKPEKKPDEPEKPSKEPTRKPDETNTTQAKEDETEPPKTDSRQPVIESDPPRTPRFHLSTAVRMVALFGDDSDQVTSGPGALLSFGWRMLPKLLTAIDFSYAYHPQADDGPALQAMTLMLTGKFFLPAGPLDLRLGGGLGTLAMGTRDRYDHWGLVLAGSAALSWPREGFWAVALELQPSLLIAASEVSFYLPINLAAELRW